MPIKYKKKKMKVEDGFICDVCENKFFEVEVGVRIEHTFGFFSMYDGDAVEAIVCDNCFYDLIKKNVKNARFYKVP